MQRVIVGMDVADFVEDFVRDGVDGFARGFDVEGWACTAFGFRGPGGDVQGGRVRRSSEAGQECVKGLIVLAEAMSQGRV